MRPIDAPVRGAAAREFKRPKDKRQCLADVTPGEMAPRAAVASILPLRQPKSNDRGVLTTPPLTKVWDNSFKEDRKMARRILPTLITAAISGAVGFGAGVYATPPDKADEFRALVDSKLDEISVLMHREWAAIEHKAKAPSDAAAPTALEAAPKEVQSAVPAEPAAEAPAADAAAQKDMPDIKDMPDANSALPSATQAESSNSEAAPSAEPAAPAMSATPPDAEQVAQAKPVAKKAPVAKPHPKPPVKKPKPKPTPAEQTPTPEPPAHQ